MKKISCSCGMEFLYVQDYADHMSRCPMKCSRCKDWFNDINKYLQHPCKPVPNMED